MPSVPEPRCVVCRKRPVDPVHRPFCSQRCRLIDLARWADGAYSVSGEAVSPDADTGDDQTDKS